MELFSSAAFLWLFGSGIVVGIFAIVFGGTMFLSLPIFQLLLPELTLGAVIGNIKFGSVIRNLTALVPLRKHVDVRDSWSLIAALLLGGAIGALSIASLSQAYVLPVLILAFIVLESAPWIARHITKQLYILLGLLVAMYGGIFGGGIYLLIMALVRIRIPADEQILTVRSTTVFLEFTNAAAAVCAFLYLGQIYWPIALTWAAGSLLGGYLGGVIIAKTGKCPPGLQKLLLRAIFVFAIAIAVYRLM